MNSIINKQDTCNIKGVQAGFMSPLALALHGSDNVFHS